MINKLIRVKFRGQQRNVELNLVSPFRRPVYEILALLDIMEKLSIIPCGRDTVQLSEQLRLFINNLSDDQIDMSNLTGDILDSILIGILESLRKRSDFNSIDFGNLNYLKGEPACQKEKK